MPLQFGLVVFFCGIACYLCASDVSFGSDRKTERCSIWSRANGNLHLGIGSTVDVSSSL